MSRNEEVASRLLEFIEDARHKASGVGFQSQAGEPSSWKTPLEQLYGRCVVELTAEERDARQVRRCITLTRLLNAEILSGSPRNTVTWPIGVPNPGMMLTERPTALPP